MKKTMDLRVVTYYELPDEEDLDAVKEKMDRVLDEFQTRIAGGLGGRWVRGKGGFTLDRTRAARADAKRVS